MVRKKKSGKSKSEPTSDPTTGRQFLSTAEEFPSLQTLRPQEPSSSSSQVSIQSIASDIKSGQMGAHSSTSPPSHNIPRSATRALESSPETRPLEPESSVRPKEGPITGGIAEDIAKPEQSKGSKQKQLTEEEKALVEEMEKKIVVRAKPPMRPFAKRPGHLTEGDTVQLLANHFLLRVGKKQAFHYDIEIEAAPKPTVKDTNIVDKAEAVAEPILKEKQSKYTRKTATKVNRKIFEAMINCNSGENGVFEGINPVYDGQKNMFTSKILRGTEPHDEDRALLRLRVDLHENGRLSTFFVNIKLAETNYRIDLNILNLYHNGRTCDDEVVKKSILFINTLLRHKSTMELTPIGQSIFDPKNMGQSIGKFVNLAYGHYSSVRNLMVGPTLNVDRSAACFYSPLSIDKLVSYILRGDLSRIPKMSDSQRRAVKKELAGLQVEATHIKYGGTGNNYRKYRILGLSINSAKDHKFEWIDKDGEGKDVNKGQFSVAEYFSHKYHKKLDFPHLPCLEVGNPSNKVYLPLEVCRIVPQQRLRRSLTNAERSEMTTIAGAQQPRDRLAQCKKYVNDQYHFGPIAEQNKPFLYEFGIDVEKGLLEVESKVIAPPLLKYNNNKTVTPQRGEWEMYKNKSTFLKAASLQKWIIINMSFEESFTNPNIQAFAEDLISQAREMGMNISPQEIIVKIAQYVGKPQINTTFNGIKTNIQGPKLKGLQMILFVTPVKSHPFSDDIYSEIKLLGDVEKDIATQCVNVANIWNPRGGNRCRKWNRSYLRHLMLKVNPKLGGTNVALSPTPAMPPILKTKSLMIVGADVNHPAPADRIKPSIAAVVGSYDNEFSNYYTTTKMQPKSREEMIQKLDQMMKELLEYYHKCQKCLPQKIIFYRDGVSDGQFQHVIDNEYALLIKAFNSFGPNYKPMVTFIIVQKRHHTRFVPKDIRDPRFQNISPGTVVDKSVTHKTDFDFFLCSHEGRLGTSRPPHYYVLADDNGFNANDMCKMTYYLCHIYQRCTKSVSIPAPVYYADLAAYRAKIHASGFQDYELGGQASDVSSSTSGDSGRDNTHEESKIKSYEQLIKVNPNQRKLLYYC